MRRGIEFGHTPAGCALLLLLGAGCSAGPDWASDAASSSRAAAQVLGEHILSSIPSPAGPVVLIHPRFNDDEAADWVKGLEAGLDSAASVEVWGPAKWPEDLRRGIEGAGPLKAGIAEFPDAAAVVSAVTIGSYEAPSFPEPHPPLFALEWEYLPDSAFLIADGDFKAGVFRRALVDPQAEIPSSSTLGERFDSHYVLVTVETLAEQLADHRRAEEQGL